VHGLRRRRSGRHFFGAKRWPEGIGILALAFHGHSRSIGIHFQLTSSITHAEHSRHGLDICRPSGKAAAPVIIFFYGGAWRSAEAFIADTLRSAELGSRWPHNSHNIAVI